MQPSIENSEPKTEADAAKAGLRSIKAGLRGPVIDALKGLVPELQGFDRDDLFARIMNTPELAALCFKVFRAKPAQFQSVLEGPDGQTIVNDHQPLKCGRTLAEVIALIVRAVARRYFRANLNGKTRRFGWRSAQRNLLRRAAELLGIAPPAARRRRRTAESIGDRVYRALYDYLLFEWQVQLIPEYANIPLEVIPEIAPFLHSARDAAALRTLVVTKKRPESGPPSALHPVGPADARGW